MVDNRIPVHVKLCPGIAVVALMMQKAQQNLQIPGVMGSIISEQIQIDSAGQLLFLHLVACGLQNAVNMVITVPKGPCVLIGIEPVSYTHLDVYKRQVYYCLSLLDQSYRDLIQTLKRNTSCRKQLYE